MPFDNRSRNKGLRDGGRRDYLEINEPPITVLFSKSRVKICHAEQNKPSVFELFWNAKPI